MTRNPLYVNPPASQSIADPNANAVTATLANVDVKVAGATNLYIAQGNAVDDPLYWFGEQIDDTPIVIREFFNDIPGDSQGGPQGPPIERQSLGRIIQLSFNLSTWSQRVRYLLENQNNVYSVPGAVKDYEVGAPLLQYHSFRLLIVGTRDNRMTAGVPADKSDDYFTFNFPTVLMSSPIECGQSSKFSTLSFTLEAHKTSTMHAKRGVIWDRDVTGLSSAVSAREDEMTAQYEAIMAERRKNGPVVDDE